MRDITRMIPKANLPEELEFQLHLTCKLARIIQSLQVQIDDGLRDSVILASSNEFETIPCRRKRTTNMELQCIGAKLMLFGWSFDLNPRKDVSIAGRSTTAEPLLSKKLILYEAFGAAISYIHTFGEVRDSSATSNHYSTTTHPPPQIYLPKAYFAGLYFAALTLYHFLSSLPQCSLSDQDIAKNHIRLAHTLLSRCGIGNSGFEWARLARNIEMIGEFVNAGRRLPPDAQIQSRWGAKLFYDSMYKLAILKAERGGRSFASDLSKGPIVEERSDGANPNRTIEEDRFAEGQTLNGSGNDVDQTSENLIMQSQERLDDPPQQWDENALWGWDLSSMDAADFQIDWTALEGWQL